MMGLFLLLLLDVTSKMLLVNRRTGPELDLFSRDCERKIEITRANYRKGLIFLFVDFSIIFCTNN